MTPDEYRSILKDERRRQSIRAVIGVSAIAAFFVLLLAAITVMKNL